MTYPPTPTTHTPKALVRNVRQEKAHAHGTVVIKLTCVEVALMRLEEAFAHDKPALAHLAKIRRWLESCWRSAGQGSKRKLSAAVLRRVDDETAMVDAAKVAVTGTEWTVDVWASWLVCLDALIHDVVCTWEGGKTAGWRYLGMTWESLARQFLKAAEDGDRAEENGTAIYERIVEELEW